MIHTLLAVLLF